MAKKTIVKKKSYDLLDSIEHTVALSKNSKMCEELLQNKYVANLAQHMGVTPVQAVIFSLCMHYGPANTLMSELAEHLDLSKISVLHFGDDIDELVSHKLLRYRDSDQMSFDVPIPVINELKHNRVYTPPSLSGLDANELFSRLNVIFTDLKEGYLKADRAVMDVRELLDSNPDLQFVRNLKELKLGDEMDVMLLVMFCHYCVNDDDNNILFGDFDDLYARPVQFVNVRNSLRMGTHPLQINKLIEYVCEDGQACTTRFRLTDWAKGKLLSEFNLSKAEEKVAGLIRPADLVSKPLYYTEVLKRQVDELTGFVGNEEFQQICRRMKEKGFHSGLACLFYGGPGTGKTETVYQIARKTGRGVLLVDVPQIKSKWVGDSEKNIQAVFTQYRNLVERMPVAPILLFNEADAIIGSRKKGAENAVDKMENAIQNIILQEMENLEGILIATTNLEGNLDPAFERRFLYKIKFEKPDTGVRQHIWHAMMPQLALVESAELAAAYSFSGAQIENVARKVTVYEILHGAPTDYLSLVHAYCAEERLQPGHHRKCGFV